MDKAKLREKVAIRLYVESGKRLQYGGSELRSEMSFKLEKDYVQESWFKEVDQIIALLPDEAEIRKQEREKIVRVIRDHLLNPAEPYSAQPNQTIRAIIQSLKEQ